MQGSLDFSAFFLASLVAFLSALFYWHTNKKNKDLEHRVMEKLIEDYERRNQQSIEDNYSGRTDIDIFNEAVQRGIDAEVSKRPTNKGDK